MNYYGAISQYKCARRLKLLRAPSGNPGLRSPAEQALLCPGGQVIVQLLLHCDALKPIGLHLAWGELRRLLQSELGLHLLLHDLVRPFLLLRDGGHSLLPNKAPALWPCWFRRLLALRIMKRPLLIPFFKQFPLNLDFTGRLALHNNWWPSLHLLLDLLFDLKPQGLRLLSSDLHFAVKGITSLLLDFCLMPITRSFANSRFAL